jgi:uncharacterized membrane-anchored protein
MLVTRLARVVAVALLMLTFTTVAAAGPTRKPAPAPTATPAATSAPATTSTPDTDPPAAEHAPRWTPGPTSIELGHELVLDLPEPYIFLGGTEAGKLLEKAGTFHNENLLGVVASKDPEVPWFVTIRYQEEGFIKDDEKIDANELLEAIREGTEEANQERAAHGFPALHVTGWAEPPRYEKSVHHLVWALNAQSERGTSVNFNTRILGRRGYVALNLVTSPERLAGDKPDAATLLAATSFKKGSRYEDFDSAKDKVAEYGLIGLVLGGAGIGAAKLVKVGLLAKFGKVLIGLLVAGKKAVVALFAAGAAFLKKIFGGKKAEEKK